MSSRRLAVVLASVAPLAAAFAWLASACGGPAAASHATERDASLSLDGLPEGPQAEVPSISALAIVPNPNSVLSATVTFTTSAPAFDHAFVTNLGDGGAGNSFSTPPSSAMTTSHVINVIGLRSSSTFDIAVAAVTVAGQAVGHLSFTTPALPADLPPFQVVTNTKARTAPGFTLLTTWKWEGAQPDPATSYLAALDGDGQVVWYASVASLGLGIPTDPEKLANGHLAVILGDGGWAELDMMGNVVASHLATPMGLDSLHNDLYVEPTGNHLSLSTELELVSGFRTDDGGKATYPLVGDIVVEFAPDAAVLNRYSAFDFLAPWMLRTGAPPAAFVNTSWNAVYPDAGDTKDWTHGDSVFRDPTDGNIVYSSRTQSWIAKIDNAGQLLWRLGAGGDFTLQTADGGVSADWQYNQHAAYVMSNGHVMCFDDGDSRPVTDAGPPGPDGGPSHYSRAVEFALNTTLMTARVAWQYQEVPSFYSVSYGSAYQLSNGNILICDGGEVADRSTSALDPGNLKFARILEVTHDPSPVKVLDIEVQAPLGGIAGDPGFAGFSVYRARRVGSLY